MNRAEMMRLLQDDPQTPADAVALLTAALANHEGGPWVALTDLVEPIVETPERAAAALFFMAAQATAMLAEFRALGVDPNLWLQRCATKHQEART